MSILQWRRHTNFSVRLQDGTAFTMERGGTLLETALRSGLRAPHNFRVGACTTCRCRVVSGKAKSLIDRAYVLQPQEIADQVFLARQMLPASDLVVDWEMQRDADVKHAATVVGLRQLTPRVWRVSISVDAELSALPGQYVCVTEEPVRGEPGVRQFSLVTVTVAQHKTVLEIDVARRPGGCMSGWLTREDAIESSLLIEGPFGNCVAQKELAPLIAVGAGSGIGAALGVLCYSHRRWPMRATALLAYGVQANDIYGIREVADSAAAAGVQHFARASVEEPPVTADMSHGRAPAGLVAAFNDAAAMAHADGKRNCQVLLYGPPGFVGCCVDVLVRVGVSAERIRFDHYQPYSAARSPAPAQQC